MEITAEDLFASIKEADEEVPLIDGAWIDKEFGLSDVYIDGRVNLENVAKILSSKVKERANV